MRIQPIYLVIFDFQMPKLNGIEAIQRIRSYIKRLNSESEMEYQQNPNREHGKIEVIEPLFVI